jgi:hypothetical protein
MKDQLAPSTTAVPDSTRRPWLPPSTTIAARIAIRKA